MPITRKMYSRGKIDERIQLNISLSNANTLLPLYIKRLKNLGIEPTRENIKETAYTDVYQQLREFLGDE